MKQRPLTRRQALAGGASAFVAALAGCETGTDDGETTEPTPDVGGSTGTPTDAAAENDASAELTVRAEQVASGFTVPVGIEVAGDGRRFVVDQAGEVYLHNDDGLADEPYLDLSEAIVDLRSSFDERGLLGLALHPEFEENGRLFVRYSSPPREGTPNAYSHTFVLSEFRADPGADRADPDSERTVLEIPEPQFNHDAGSIAFGPDGYLYVGVGDGGGANDQGAGHVEDWYDAVEGGNGQDVTENLLGSILRIDVDAEPTEHPRSDDDAPDEPEGEEGYAIPEDNPLVGEEGLDEHFAWGFRNPWRMSFGPEGRLFVADVGQDEWEEVNVVERGGNYGWNVEEGSECFMAEECPSETPDGEPLVDPVIEYPTGGGADVSGAAVIGGYLYDGEAIPELQGRYVFADWLAEGRLFVAEEADEGPWPTAELPVESEAEFGPNVLSFGRDPEGELLVCTNAETGVQGETGAVFRLRSA